MSSSFVYQPHVHQSDGTIITPDIAIERVYIAGPAGLEAVPTARLTSAAALQQPADAPVGAPAVVLLAASYGLLVCVGAVLGDVLAIGRAAWRFDDIERSYSDIDLVSWTTRSDARSALLSEKLGALMQPVQAMEALGNPAGLKPGTAVFIGPAAVLGESVAIDSFAVSLESNVGALSYEIQIDILD